jgi:hypothetical protein
MLYPGKKKSNGNFFFFPTQSSNFFSLSNSTPISNNKDSILDSPKLDLQNLHPLPFWCSFGICLNSPCFGHIIVTGLRLFV